MLQQACSYSHTAGSCSLSSGGGGAPPRVYRSGVPPRLPSIVTVSEDTPDDSIWVISPVTNSLYPAPNFSTSGTVFTLISFYKKEHTRNIRFICMARSLFATWLVTSLSISSWTSSFYLLICFFLDSRVKTLVFCMPGFLVRIWEEWVSEWSADSRLWSQWTYDPSSFHPFVFPTPVH